MFTISSFWPVVKSAMCGGLALRVLTECQSRYEPAKAFCLEEKPPTHRIIHPVSTVINSVLYAPDTFLLKIPAISAEAACFRRGYGGRSGHLEGVKRGQTQVKLR